MKQSWQLFVPALLSFFLFTNNIILANPASQTVKTMSADFGPPLAENAWQKFSITLDAETFGVNPDDFEQILANVKMFRIRMEMSDARDTGGLDSVCVGNTYMSEFTAGTDGWTCSGDGTMEWRPGAGKSGGYLQISDWGTGDWHWAIAPLEWSGNWMPLQGTLITFYYKTDHPDYAAIVEITAEENKRLTLTADPLMVPMGSYTLLRVGLNEVASTDVVVTINSSNDECLSAPETVTIRRGEQDIVFSVNTTTFSSPGCYSVISASAEEYGETRMTLYVGKSSDMFKNGVLEGRVTDALHGDGIEGAIVSIAGLLDTTDINGRYRIENIPTNLINANFTAEPRSGKAPLTAYFYDLSDVGHYIASASAEGYYRSETVLSFYEGEIKYIDFSLSPVIGPGEYRLVLNWGSAPKDLDLHLLTPAIEGRTYEIYWDNKGNGESIPFVALDIDRQEGFGPETITIKKMYSGTYRCFVENYSVTPDITSSYAVVQIYGSEGLLRTVNIPTSGNGLFWRVCDINGSTGEITVYNTLTNSSPAGMSLSKTAKTKNDRTLESVTGIVSWAWDFENDGIVDSYLQNPEHTYYSPGYYTVTLRVSDGTQDFIMTKENYISVQPAIVTDVAWRHQNSLVSNDLYAVCAVDTLRAWAAGTNGCILRTYNGGQTWISNFTYPQFTLHDLFFINANTGWAVGTDTKQNAVILKSDNSGAHWTRWPSSTDTRLFANHMVSSTAGFNCGQDGKIEKTVDGGANWAMQFTGIVSVLRGIYFLNTDFGWAVGDNGVVLKTIDGGANWILQTSGISEQINDVFFVNELFGWAVTANGKVLATTNGGTTWAQKQVSEDALDAVYFDNTYYGYVVGAYGRIYKTLDAGETWTLDMSGTGQYLHALHIISNTCAWAVGNGGTILRLQRGAKFPEPVTFLYATTAGPNTIHLSWTNPTEPDYAGTVLQRKLGSYPANANDGVRVYNGTGNHYTDTGLAPSTTYYYAAFTYNSSGFYSNAGLSSRTYATTAEAIALYGYHLTISSIDAAAFPLVKSFVSVVDSASLTPVTGLTAANFNVKENSSPQSPITVEAMNITSGAKADIVFVFDTTGSMGGEIDALKLRASTFADALAAKGIDYRLALITFGDEVEQVHKFTADISTFKGWIGALYASGGGDTKENALEGLAAATQMDFRTVSQRIAILITDAPYHQDGETGGDGTSEYTTESMVALLKEYRIMTNVVGPDEPQFHQIADGTGGLFFDINGDFQAIIDRIGSVLSSQYVISYTTHNPNRDNTWRNVFISAEKGDKGGYDTGRYFVSGEIQNVRYFYATAISYDRIYCRWANPAFTAFAGVKVVRKLGSYPINWMDGTIIYEGAGTSCTDVGLSPETLYYYCAFAYDNSGQVSTPTESAQGTARTWPFWSMNTSWKAQNSGFSNNLYAVSATDTMHVWVAGMEGSHARSMNGGLAWEQRFVSENIDVFDLTFISNATGWLVGQEDTSAGLNMKTGSAGWSWTKWPSSSEKTLFANSMVNDRIGWNVGGDGHIEKTTDGGAHWIQQYHNIGYIFRDVAFVDTLTGWVVGDDGMIMKTMDGGVSWTTQKSMISSKINGVWFLDHETGWAVTADGTILSTSNGGTIWNSRTMDEMVFTDVHFSDPFNGCIVGHRGSILR
ncbi:VWA domain-containing protein, partial [candidate division KSB1 bacterium]|nr:VWA domain-containing protein [candidate division KSB1 bacterium]